MSMHHRGLWHWEYIPDRNNGRCYRVADEDDDVVTDFETEAEANDFVTAHNKQVATGGPAEWHYGAPPDQQETNSE